MRLLFCYLVFCECHPKTLLRYADHKNDSIYTNWVAVRSLRFAAAAADILGDRSFNTSRWIDVSNRISLIYDADADYHPEFAGYKGKTVKQADVVLLPFPLLMPMNISTRSNDLKFYENRTDSNGPAMTWAMFAIGHWDAGHVDEAQSLFNRSYANVQEPYGVWTETPSGGTTNFITGAGGFLQGVINGLAGVRLSAGSSGTGSSITFHPQCSSSLAASSGAVNGVCVRAFSCCARHLRLFRDRDHISHTSTMQVLQVLASRVRMDLVIFPPHQQHHRFQVAPNPRRRFTCARGSFPREIAGAA